MQLTNILNSGLLLFVTAAHALPNPDPSPAPLSSSPNGLPGCRCDGWDHGPSDIRCYLTPWSPQLARAGWTGTPGDYFCATYRGAASTVPDMDLWYACPAARGNGKAESCEPCAQSGSGSTNLCRGNPACFENGHNYWTGADKIGPRRCGDFIDGGKMEVAMCPMISEEDMECGRQWWACGKAPSPQSGCWGKGKSH